MRAITSPDTVVSGPSVGTVTVTGTTLESPPAQPNGGGINSTLTSETITLGNPLANGAGINVQFLLGVKAAGSFNFYVNIEALP